MTPEFWIVDIGIPVNPALKTYTQVFPRQTIVKSIRQRLRAHPNQKKSTCSNKW